MQGNFLEKLPGGFPKVKVCGFTQAENLKAACGLGIDAAGFVLFAKSRRAVTEDGLDRLIPLVPESVTPVVLFVNPDEETVRRVLSKHPQILLQFHGTETPEFCSRFGAPYMKAVPFREPGDLLRAERSYAGAAALLADCPVKAGEVPGGTGNAFSWGKAAEEIRSLSLPLIAAGGLTPENAAEAARILNPSGLDVSSGVEVQSGVKSEEKIRKFLKAVRA